MTPIAAEYLLVGFVFLWTVISETVPLDGLEGGKMKRVCGFLVVVACILFLAGFAQAVDIVSFMGMKAGRWNQYAMSDNCGNPKDDWGQKVVKTSEGNFIWKYYQKENSIWVYQDADIFKLKQPNSRCWDLWLKMAPGYIPPRYLSPDLSRSTPLLFTKGPR